MTLNRRGFLGGAAAATVAGPAAAQSMVTEMNQEPVFGQSGFPSETSVDWADRIRTAHSRSKDPLMREFGGSHVHLYEAARAGINGLRSVSPPVKALMRGDWERKRKTDKAERFMEKVLSGAVPEWMLSRGYHWFLD